MRPIEIELWVHRVAEQALSGEHTEDALVELKSEWPLPAEAARRIAAHANAARGAPILWIIGVDETSGAVGAGPIEVADWFASVCSHFDQVHPELQDVNVRIGTHTVVALQFNTDRAPYVVKNQAYGKKEGGAVQWEVPWREGRKTRTATRQDLLRLLAPLTSLPQVECLSCQLRVCREWTDDAMQITRWYVSGSLYVIPQSPATIVYPFHRCTIAVEISGKSLMADSSGLSLSTTNLGTRVEGTSTEIFVSGPGVINFSVARTAPMLEGELPREVTCTLRLPAINAMRATTWSGTLNNVPPGNDSIAKWELPTFIE